MEFNNIEKHFKTQLSEYESAIDAGQLWDGIRAQKPVDNKKYWLFGLLIGAVLLLPLGYYLYKYQTKPNAQSVPVVMQDVQSSNNQPSSSTVPLLTTQETDQITESNSDIHYSNTTETKSLTSATTEEVTQTSSQIITKTKSVDPTNSTTLPIASKKGNHLFTKKIIQNNSSSTSVLPIDQTKTNADLEEIVSNTKVEADVQANIDHIQKNDLTSTLLSNKFNQNLLLSTRELSFPNPVECPDFGQKRGHLSLLLHGIPYYSMRRFKPLNAEGEQWMKSKQTYESYLETFQVNLLGQYQFRNGFYLQGGVGYGQLDEKLDFLDITSYDVEEVGPTIIIIYGGGIPNDTIEQTRTVTYYDTLGAKTYNYHRMAELPISIGFESRSGNIGFYADAGIAFNLKTSRKGYSYYAGNAIAFDDPSYKLYSTTTGLKLNGSVGINYYPTSRLGLTIGPDFRYHMNNWLHDSRPLELRYLDIGLRLGMKLIL